MKLCHSYKYLHFNLVSNLRLVYITVSISVAFLLLSNVCLAQIKPLDSKVYTWDSATITNKKFPLRTIFDGSDIVFAKHSITNSQLNAGTVVKLKKLANVERFVMVQSGVITVSLNAVTKDLVKGSVVFLLPDDELVITNNSQSSASYYTMQYQSKTPTLIDATKKLSPSFILDWKDLVFKATAKGGGRQYFNIQTPILNRFDIHVTTLNPGFKSHDPHTHKNEEIILMLDGNGEMQIGETHQKSNAGDAVFLNSMVLHNITNVGTVPCMYFAIQWN